MNSTQFKGLQETQNHARIVYVGHATLLIEMEGVRLLTDPILRDRVSFLRRNRSARLDPALHENIDAVLISHLHRDHLDVKSLHLLGTETRLIIPRGTAPLLRQRGFRNLEEIQVGETTTVGALTIRATHAEHNPARHPFGLKADCLGYLIQGHYTVYFPGDTDLFTEMGSLIDELDVALLPVWGWGPTLGTGHMDPKRAAEALALLEPRMAIPIHWGSLHPAGMELLNPDFMTLPPLTFAHHAASLAPNVDIQIVQPGGSISLDGQFS